MVGVCSWRVAPVRLRVVTATWAWCCMRPRKGCGGRHGGALPTWRPCCLPCRVVTPPLTRGTGQLRMMKALGLARVQVPAGQLLVRAVLV